MQPYPGPRSVLVMDNCRIHHVEEVEAICDERGIKLVYLPPYSPDYNPIEQSFSFIKSYIRRNGQRFREIMKHGEDGEAEGALYEAIAQVTEVEAQGFFRHSRYL
uniref:TPR domain protein n=1 Tax=Mycena chlorophos TaxID=658473 RepID=A0ABQ0LNV2_MYCCL|nr:TPR domain protein [Mycena chlorophos]